MNLLKIQFVLADQRDYCAHLRWRGMGRRFGSCGNDLCACDRRCGCSAIFEKKER
jgi:hypothetical protein